MQILRFDSKKDFWIVLALGLALTPLVYSIGNSSQKPTLDSFLDLAVAAALLGFVVWVYLATYYVVDADKIAVRSGPFRFTVVIQEIERVLPSKSLVSSPALSLDRLLIVHKKGQILLSPENKGEFVEILKRLNPNISFL